MNATAERPALDRIDADTGWWDSAQGARPNSFLRVISSSYEAGYAWELLTFVRNPVRCTPLDPRRWPGHDHAIRQQVLRQLDQLGPDRFERSRRREQRP